MHSGCDDALSGWLCGSGIDSKEPTGFARDLPYGKSFESANLNTSAVGDIESNIKKLKSGRIDAFVAYVPDAYAAFDKMGLPPFPHNKAAPIAEHPDSLVCRGVAASFVDAFNATLK